MPGIATAKETVIDRIENRNDFISNRKTIEPIVYDMD